MARKVNIDIVVHVDDSEYKKFIKTIEKPQKIKIDVDSSSIDVAKKATESLTNETIKATNAAKNLADQENNVKNAAEGISQAGEKISNSWISSFSKIKNKIKETFSSAKKDVDDFEKSSKKAMDSAGKTTGFFSKENFKGDFVEFRKNFKENITGSLSDFASKAPGVGMAMNLALGPVAILVAGVAAGIALLVEATDNLAKKEAEVSRLAASFRITSEEAEKLRQELQETAQEIGADFDDYQEAYLKLSNSNISATKEQLESIQAFARLSGKSMEDVADALAGASRGEKDALQELIGEFEERDGKLLKVIDGQVREFNNVTELLEGVADSRGIGSIVEKDGKSVTDTLSRITSKIEIMWERFTTSKGFEVTVKTVLGLLELIIDGVDLLGQGVSWVQGKFANFFNEMGDGFTWLGTKIQEFGIWVSKTWNELLENNEWLSDIITTLQSKFNELSDVVLKVYNKMKPYIESFFNFFSNSGDAAKKSGANMLSEMDKVQQEVKKREAKAKADAKKAEEEKEKEKKKEQEKGQKAQADQRKSAYAEAQKQLEEAKKQELHLINLALENEKLLSSEAVIKKLEIEKKYNQLALSTAQALTKSKSNLYKLEKTEIESNQSQLNDIIRNEELARLKLQQDIEKMSIAQAREYYSEKQKQLEKANKAEETELQKQISKTDNFAVKSALEMKLLEMKKENAQEEINLEIEKFNKLSAMGDDEVQLNLEKEQEITDIIDQQTDKRIEILKHYQEMQETIQEKLKNSLYESLSSISGIGGSVAETLQGFDSLTASTEKYNEEVENLNTLLAEGVITQDEFNNVMQSLDAQKMADVAASVGQILTGIINGVSQMIQQANEMAINSLDKEIATRQKNIEAIKEETEAMLERSMTIQEIENKLAEQRIEELEALREQLPEAQKERADKDLETERAKIQSIDGIKEKSAKQEQRRIKQEEKAIEAAELKKRKLQAEGFETARAAQIAAVIIQGAVAAIQAFSSLAATPFVGVALGAAAAAGVAALTAVQVALIASQPNPYALADGVKDTRMLRYAGAVEGKDSIPATLMPGEMVVPASTVDEYRPALNAIFDKKIPANLLNDIILNNPNAFLNNNTSKTSTNVNVFNDKNIVKAIENQKRVEINIDEQGLNKYIKNVNEESKILDKKMKIYL